MMTREVLALAAVVTATVLGPVAAADAPATRPGAAADAPDTRPVAAANGPATRPLAEASKDAADARRQYDRAVAALREEFARKLAVARGQYRKRLEVVMATETRKGNLEAALAIRTELAALGEADASADASPSAPKGRWQVRHNRGEGAFIFEGSQVRHQRTNEAGPLARDGRRFYVRWPNGWIDQFTQVDEGRILFEGWSPEQAHHFPNQPSTLFGVATPAGQP